MRQSLKFMNVFNTLTLKQDSWKTKTSYKKLEYCFLVDTTTTESATFPYKTASSKANVRTNCVGSTTWSYQKERIFTTNCFIFFLFFFFFENLIWVPLTNSWFNLPISQMPIFILFVSVRVLFKVVFFLWVSLHCFTLNG